MDKKRYDNIEFVLSIIGGCVGAAIAFIFFKNKSMGFFGAFFDWLIIVFLGLIGFVAGFLVLTLAYSFVEKLSGGKMNPQSVNTNKTNSTIGKSSSNTDNRKTTTDRSKPKTAFGNRKSNAASQGAYGFDRLSQRKAKNKKNTMTNFEKYNQIVIEQKRQKEEERLRYENQKAVEEHKMINYLYEYLSPYVDQLANQVIRNDGKEKELVVPINKFVSEYPKTPYIIKAYTYNYGDPTYWFIHDLAVITRVNDKFRKELYLFDIALFANESSKYRTDYYYIRIKMKYKE